MTLLLNGMLSNMLIAAGLFAVVMLLRRWIKNPAVLHLLLVLILIFRPRGLMGNRES